MDHATKKATERVNNHREDGEEALKHSYSVVPIDRAQTRTSVQVTPASNHQTGVRKPQKKQSKAK